MNRFSSFFNWRVLSAGFFGLPLGLLFVFMLSSLQIWFKEAGLSNTVIGFLALSTLPNALKFIWAPFIDHFQIPILSKRWGRRRSWGILFQGGLIINLLLLGVLSPKTDLPLITVLMILISFLGASQEIVLDAYRIELLNPNLTSPGTTANVLGYRVGTIIGSAGALYLASYWGWFWVFFAMALIIFLSLCLLLTAPTLPPNESNLVHERTKKALDFLLTKKTFSHKTALGLAWLYAAVLGPFSEFVKRKSWVLIFSIILFFRLGDNLINNMANIFYLDLGFSVIDIANVTKVFGVAATITGSLIGGYLSKQKGVLRGLFLAGLLHAFSNLMFVIQTYFGYNIELLYVAIALENITGGMTTAAFVIYISSLTHRSFTGTQYAFLSALWYLSTNLGSCGGWIADHVTWHTYFIITFLLAFPGLACLASLMNQSRLSFSPEENGAG